MATDANGVYTLPAGYLAVTGQTIQASQHNPPLEDLAAAMNGRLLRSGAAAMSGQLKAVSGSTAAPGYSFELAPNTGFYKTDDGIGVTINGSKVVEFTASGLSSGARFLGELIPYTGSTALPLTVFPVGQTLLRASYPALWAFAQTEIAAGNTFYNNGDGSTTFGVGDCRGRVFAFKDNLGGTAASRLTSATMSPDGNTIGAASTASQTKALTTANLPPYTPSGSISNGAISISHNAAANTGGSSTGGGGFPLNAVAAASISASQAASTFIGSAQGGTSSAFSIVQPTLIVTCLLFAGA